MRTTDPAAVNDNLKDEIQSIRQLAYFLRHTRETITPEIRDALATIVETFEEAYLLQRDCSDLFVQIRRVRAVTGRELTLADQSTNKPKAAADSGTTPDNVSVGDKYPQ